jgi:glycerol-3-phosphate acyltransferase PlsX
MKNALRMACETITHGINPHIESALDKHLDHLEGED